MVVEQLQAAMSELRSKKLDQPPPGGDVFLYVSVSCSEAQFPAWSNFLLQIYKGEVEPTKIVLFRMTSSLLEEGKQKLAREREKKDRRRKNPTLGKFAWQQQYIQDKEKHFK